MKLSTSVFAHTVSAGRHYYDIYGDPQPLNLDHGGLLDSHNVAYHQNPGAAHPPAGNSHLLYTQENNNGIREHAPNQSLLYSNYGNPQPLNLDHGGLLDSHNYHQNPGAAHPPAGGSHLFHTEENNNEITADAPAPSQSRFKVNSVPTADVPSQSRFKVNFVPQGTKYAKCDFNAVNPCVGTLSCTQRNVWHDKTVGICRECTQEQPKKRSTKCNNNSHDQFVTKNFPRVCCELGNSEMDSALVEVEVLGDYGQRGPKEFFSLGHFIAEGTYGAVYDLFDSKSRTEFGVVKLLKNQKNTKRHDSGIRAQKNEFKFLSNPGVNSIAGVVKLLGTLTYPGVNLECPVYESLGSDLTALALVSLDHQPNTETFAGVLMIMYEVLGTLKSLHLVGIAHADIKGDNIMTPYLNQWHSEDEIFFKLVDFGLALDLENGQRPGLIHGTYVPRWRGSRFNRIQPNKFADDVECLLMTAAYLMWPSKELDVIEWEKQQKWRKKEALPNDEVFGVRSWCENIPKTTEGQQFLPICTFIMSKLYDEDNVEAHISDDAFIDEGVSDSIRDEIKEKFRELGMGNVEEYPFLKKLSLWTKNLRQ